MLIVHKEARGHLEQSTVTRTVTRGGAQAVSAGNDFLDLLRRRIFDSRKGRCLSPSELEKRYGEQAEQQALDRGILAHISSCPVCLERINEILNLPPLSERFPTDMLGNDAGPAQRRRSSGPAPGARVKDCRRLARAVYEHEPRELTIMVNGFFAASGTVAARLTEQTLAVNPTEQLSIVEAFSEQGIRLLGLHVEAPPLGPLDQSARVELSEGRYLELSIGFKGLSPWLGFSYYDPRRPEPTVLAESSERLEAPLTGIRSYPDSSDLPRCPQPPNRPRFEEVPRGRL